MITIISFGRLQHPGKVASDQRVIKDGEKGQRVEAREEMEPKRVEKEREREGEVKREERFPVQGCVAGCVLLFC